MPSIHLRRARAVITAVLLLAALSAGATPSFNSADEWNAVPTFNSIGLYWAPAGGGSTVSAQVLFREAGMGGFRQGVDLWYDDRNAEYRGSIVELKPNTAYDIKLTLSTGYNVFFSTCPAANRCTTTWSENFNVPAGWTFALGAGVMHVDVFAAAVSTPTSTISGNVQTIRVPNAPTGANYTVLTGTAPNNVIDQTSFATNLPCIDIIQGVRYFILRGLVLKNCQRAPVRMANNVSSPTDHIVIEDNEMSGWGGGTATDPFKEGAVSCAYYNETNDANRVNQVVIQRNKMHDPRYAASMWGLNGTRPSGAVAITFLTCGTNHVIRYNDIYSTDGGNYFANGIYGEPQDSAATAGIAGARGFPWADSDIYGNRLSHITDDALLAVGSNRNVRVWGNYMDKVAAGIDNASTSVGPLYVWRNVTNQVRRHEVSDRSGRGRPHVVRARRRRLLQPERRARLLLPQHGAAAAAAARRDPAVGCRLRPPHERRRGDVQLRQPEQHLAHLAHRLVVHVDRFAEPDNRAAADHRRQLRPV
jgi:hypothetical protein